MKAELCKTCIHTKVCFKDKNLFGDVFVAGNPMVFDNDKLFEKFKKREDEGFPCEDYMQRMDEVTEPSKDKCEDCIYSKEVQSKRHFDDDEAN